MSTRMINMHEAKTHLSEYIAGLKAADRIILCRRNKPVAEIRPIIDREQKPRPIGLGKGLVTIPKSFFDPLPDELIDLFEGQGR